MKEPQEGPGRAGEPSWPGLVAPAPAAWRDVCALMLLAALLNFFQLGAHSIGLDEAGSVAKTRLSLTSLVRVLTGGDPNMGLYYLLLHFWVRMFGESECAVRSLSALFATAAVPALYLLGSRLFGRKTGFVAGLLLALNAFVVQYAQTARSYALLVLLVTLSSYCFVVELEQPSKRHRVGYLLTITLAFYAHYFAAYVLAAHSAMLALLRRRAALTKAWLALAAMILLLCAPEIIFAYRGGVNRLSWIDRPSLSQTKTVFVDIAGRSQLSLLVLLASGCYTAMSAVRERRSWRHGFIAAWLLVPVMLSFAVSFVQPMFVSYYLIVCVPALILFGTAAIVQIRSLAVAAALVVLLVSLTATRLVQYYRSDLFENWRDATRYVVGAAHTEDGIVFFPDYARTPFDYYVRQMKVAGPVNIQRLPLTHQPRIWLVIRQSDAGAHSSEVQRLQSSLTEHHWIADRHKFQGVGVELYVQRAG